MSSNSTAVATRDESTAVVAPRPVLGLVRPIAAPADVLKVQEETRTMVTEILQEGRDYGVIPGTDKPSMLKPGAERTAIAFGCYYGEPEIVEKEIDHDRVNEYTKRKKIWRNEYEGDRRFEWQEEHGTSRGLYRYVVRVPVIHQASGLVIGAAIGSCSTMESKYIDRPRDSENTALKMAHKRALVGACLITFGLSDQFTQDTEDMPREQLVGENAPKLEPMDPPCPKCSGKMYDNRLSKKSAKQPDFKCKKKSCDGVIWPPRQTDAPAAAAPNGAPAPAEEADYDIAEEAAPAAPARDIAWARAFKLPFRKSPSFGKPIGEFSLDGLESIASWILEKRKENREPELHADLLTAIRLVIADVESQQGALPLEGAAPAAAGSGAPVVDETKLAPGKIEDAVAPAAPKPETFGGVAAAAAAMLKDPKLDESDRKMLRGKFDAATTLEQMKAVVAEIEKRLDLPF